MHEYVTDTHSLLWYIFGNERLSKKAAEIFVKTDEGEARIQIPGIVLVEIVYLMEKSKLPQLAIDTVIDLFDSSPENYNLCQVTVSTIRALQSIPREQIPDMPDRIIAATALELDLPLISKDKMITNAGMIEVIW
ncbi:MAG: type II toxin-antitoxin system VapC family toxin [bacterium]